MSGQTTSSIQELDSTPIERWIENIRKDRYPECEIEVWEDIIECYQDELKERVSAEFEERHLLYTAFLSASMLSEEFCKVVNVLSIQPATKSLPRLKHVIERFHQKRFG